MEKTVGKWEKLLGWFCNTFLRKKVVYGTTPDKRETLGPLLIRYYIYDGGDDSRSIYIHKLLRSDDERNLHDHPWDFHTFLLTDGYFEELPHEFNKETGILEYTNIEYRLPFKLYYRPATWAHRLLLNKPVWTLVFRGKKRREWGFYTDNGWTHWTEYKYDRSFKDDDERNEVKVTM